MISYAEVIGRLPASPRLLSRDGMMVRCLVHEDKRPSLKIIRHPDGSVGWHCFAGCDWAAVGRVLGLLTSDPFHQAKNRRGDLGDGGARADDAQRTSWARKIWVRETQPAVGTVVEDYLKARRITILPPSIRYAPRLKHPDGHYYRAMVAGVQAVDGRFTAIHRTFLDGPAKADVCPNRMALGPLAGGAVRLSPAGATLVLAEGLETSLSVQQATGLPTWATLGTGNMQAVEIPPEVSTVIIAADGDEPGRQAAHNATANLLRRGLRVLIAQAPETRDFNDILREVD